MRIVWFPRPGVPGRGRLASTVAANQTIADLLILGFGRGSTKCVQEKVTMSTLIRGGWLIALVAALSLLAPTGWAQDNAPKDKAEPEAKPEAAAGPAMAKYNQLLEEWKEVLKELRRLKSQYTNAKPEEVKALEEQWNAQVNKGVGLLPNLRTAAQDAYREGSTVDPQLQRFLLKLGQDASESDDYEVAFDLAKAMLDRAEADKAPAPKELYNVAGTAAFMTNRFEEAEKYWGLAKDAGTLAGPGEKLAGDVTKYKDWWAKEKEIREQEAKADDLPRVKLSTTAGDMVIELFENEAPDTVGNFVSLVESDFYKDVVFHRVLKGFMAQGGDPKGTGNGGPGYEIYCETDKPNFRRHFRGTLSMAHAGKDTGGSQFFMCFSPQEGLDAKHTAFGRVVEGLDTLAKIQKIDPEHPTPVERTKILKAEVLRKRDHKYLPHKVE